MSKNIKIISMIFFVLFCTENLFAKINFGEEFSDIFGDKGEERKIFNISGL